MVRPCVRDSYGPDFTFYLDRFLFLSGLHTLIAQKLLIWNTFVSSGLLAQSVERGPDNGKVRCSRLKRTGFHFLFGIVSLFKWFAYIHCTKIVNLEYICIKWSASSVGRAWC